AGVDGGGRSANRQVAVREGCRRDQGRARRLRPVRPRRRAGGFIAACRGPGRSRPNGEVGPVRLNNRIATLERSRNGHAHLDRPVDVAELAGILRRWIRGVFYETAAAAGYGTEKFAAAHVTQARFLELDDAAVVMQMIAYARHLKTGRDDLPPELADTM